MTYDFHGAWDPVLGFNAPLFAGAADKTPLQQQLNVNASLSFWLAQSGVPRDKIVVGIPFYGRSFRLVAADQDQPGDLHEGPGLGGPYTGESGNYGFNELCEYIVPNPQFKRGWNRQQAVPYYHSDKQWIGYDDMESVRIKGNYINEMALGGAMVWSIETDDFRGICGMGQFPLLTQINGIFGHAIGVEGQQPPESTEGDGATSTTTSSSSISTAISSPGPPTTTTNSSSEENSAGNGKCNEAEATWRDPGNCGVFFVCDHGNLHRFECPQSLNYDLNSSVCNWPWLVDCANNGDTTT